jgi:hypothetical protein
MSGNDGFFQLVLSPWNLCLMAAVWAGMQTVRKNTPGAWWADGTLGHWLLPWMPMPICVFFAMAVPGPWMPAGTVWGQKLVLGVILGWGSANFAPISKRLGLHKFMGADDAR